MVDELLVNRDGNGRTPHMATPPQVPKVLGSPQSPMLLDEQAPASEVHPELAAAGSQSCAPPEGQAATHDDVVGAFPDWTMQHTVPAAQFAAPLHLRAVGPSPG